MHRFPHCVTEDPFFKLFVLLGLLGVARFDMDLFKTVRAHIALVDALRIK